jgi:S1-C subfamily serine protease
MKIATVLTLLAVTAAVLAAPGTVRAEDEMAPKMRAALVKVYIETQGWALTNPWQKNAPRSRVQRGVVVRPGLVLTPASGIADHLMIEVSEANSARRYPASLALVNYGADLALVKVETPSLRLRLAPLEIHDPITLDDEFEVWQLGGSDLLEKFTGHVQQVFTQSPRLMLNVKTTLADGGDGQALIKDGKLAGLVNSTNARRQEGRVISVETIRHLLKDFDSGEMVGWPGSGLWTQNLLRDDLREYYMVPEDQHGVVVSRVIEGKTGSGALVPGDVITQLSGHDLDDEGMYVDPVHGRLHMSNLLYCQPYAGDKLSARIYRKGEPMDVEVPVPAWKREDTRVPSNYNDRRPPYILVGGLVVLELSRNSPTGDSQLRQYQMRVWWDPPSERKRIVYAYQVLPDPANKGMDTISRIAILTVNGRKITKISDVPEALKHPLDGWHVITFEGVEKPYVMKASELDEINNRILERYRIPELSYITDGE